MANDVNITIKAKNKVTGPVRKAGREIRKLGEDAAKSGKQARQDWGGLGDLFTGLLPRGLQSTLRGFKSAQRQIGRLSKGFKVLKGAIASTGLGLLVVALGEIVANWDSISASITSATDETNKQVESAKELTASSKEQLDNISATENILKVQGKTEEDILAMRMAATDEAIAAQRIMIEALKTQKKEQDEAAQTARTVTQNIIRLLTAPLTAALGIIDSIAEGLVQLGVIEEGLGLEEKFSGGIADLLFDPEGVAEEGQKAIDEAEAQLTRLENQRAGYTLRKEKMDEQADDKAQAERDRAADKAAADEQYRADRIFKINQDLELRRIEDDEERELRKREMQFESEQAELKARGATVEQLKVLEDQYQMDRAAISQRYRDQEDAAAQQELENQQQLQDELFELGLSAREREELALVQAYERRVALAGDDEGLISAAYEQFLKEQQELTDEYDNKEIESAERVGQMRVKAAADAVSMLQSLNEWANAGQKEQSEQAFKTQQALSIAETVISTYSAAQGAYQSQMIPPTPDAPIRASIAAGAAIAAGMARVAKIRAQKWESPDAGGDTAQAPNPMAGLRMPASYGPQGGAGLMAGMAAPNFPQPEALHAYVVQSELQGATLDAQRLAYQTVL